VTSDALVHWPPVPWKRVAEHDRLEPVIDEFAVERSLRDARLRVTPGRIELPTYGLGNRRSIQLSYGAVGAIPTTDRQHA
jgi:hypothetical protein